MSRAIMQCRYEQLQKAYDGFLHTGVSLMHYQAGQCIPTFTADDIGIYVLIPHIAYYFNLDIYKAISLFFDCLIFVPSLIGLVGFLFLYKGWLERLVAIIGVTLLTVFIFRETSDVYLAYSGSIIALIPWAIYFWHKKDISPSFIIFCCAAGMSISFFHQIRAHSATAALLFIAILILTHAFLSWKKKIMLVSSLILGFGLIEYFFHRTYNNYITYSQSHFPHHTIDSKGHVFWHPLYLGLGFLNNQFGIVYRDDFSLKKVQAFNPLIQLNSQESELILKNEFISTIKKDKYFFVFNIAAKLGVLLIFFLIFANIGIVASYLFPKNWRLEIAFLIAFIFNSLFGLLIIPSIQYCIGFIACCALYGIVSINYALEHCMPSKLLSYLNWSMWSEEID